jgi:hypothetical protein
MMWKPVSEDATETPRVGTYWIIEVLQNHEIMGLSAAILNEWCMSAFGPRGSRYPNINMDVLLYCTVTCFNGLEE